MSEKQQYRVVSYHYYCKECSKTFKYILDFDDRLKEYACPFCHNKLKYRGGFDVATSATGNCGYRSAESQSSENIKNLGKEQYEKMIDSDRVSKKQRDKKKKESIPWWRGNLPDQSKPLDLNKVKDVNKYIETGDMG